MKQLSLHLDWTPNTNHIGFYFAKAQGFYKEAGIELEIRHPGQDNYQTTPARALSEGKVDFALAPTESLFSYAGSQRSQYKPVAVAAVLQSDASALVVAPGLDVTRPAQLDGKRYASYAAKYEDFIVKALIKADGGKGDISLHYPAKLSIWDELEEGRVDFTWIFLPWEGVLREFEGQKLQSFRFEDWKIPYSYSPLLLTRAEFASEDEALVQAFTEASKRGWESVVGDESAAVELLYSEVPEGPYKSKELLAQSLEALKPHLFKEGKWGAVDPEQVAQFRNWLLAGCDLPKATRDSLEPLKVEDLVYTGTS